MVVALEHQSRRIAEAVRDAGGRALCVGGFVRDRLRSQARASTFARGASADRSARQVTVDSKDLDMEVFGIPQEALLALLRTLGRVDPVGQAFPVYKIGGVDVALPRRESKTGRGHKGFAVEGDPSMSFDQAARRRDFTINAIGWDPLTGEYLDPFNGRADLEKRVLKVVDPATFADDSLRVLRALQFSARFELTIDPATAALCASIPLDDLPAERIWGEFEKLL
ncbi:MAG: metal-dependent phosphohydrolase, partial [Acidobacteriota bacterium]|nr:metal-dependent phosphohydrolase [Acidobacteriota bacterium]